MNQHTKKFVNVGLINLLVLIPTTVIGYDVYMYTKTPSCLCTHIDPDTGKFEDQESYDNYQRSQRPWIKLLVYMFGR